MAVLKQDNLAREYVVVEKGDTLWGISKTYASKISGSTTQAKVNTLVDLNDITNPNYIVVGQKIYLSTSSANKTNTTNVARIKAFGLQSGTDRTIYATWTWTKSNTENYQTKWWYDTGDGVWFVGNDSTTTEKQSLYSAPSNAKRVKFQVKPISKKRTVNKKETAYWTASWSTAETYSFSLTLPKLAKPQLELISPGDFARAVYTELDDDVFNYVELAYYAWNVQPFEGSTLDPGVPWGPGQYSQFSRIGPDGNIIGGVITPLHKIEEGRVEIIVPTYVYAHQPGFIDRPASIKCRAVFIPNSDGKDWTELVTIGNSGRYGITASGYIAGEWSEMSNLVLAQPGIPNAITECKAALDKDGQPTAVYLEWTPVWGVDNYDVEYTEDEHNFDSTQGTTTVSTVGSEANIKITGLTIGTKYFFRVRGVRDESKSEWSEIVSIAIGTIPTAPTTWSSTASAIIGEPLILYWTHNCEDGSDQTYARVLIYINDSESPDIEKLIEGDTSFLEIDTTEYEEGAKISWQVKTAGVTNEYGELSEKKSVDIYAKPTLTLGVSDSDSNILDVVTSFPFYITSETWPKTQTPLGYSVTIVSNEHYETVDSVGNSRIITAGSPVYSKFFDTSDQLLVEMSAGMLDLENNVSYTLTCLASMNSGLQAEDSFSFTVEWAEIIYEPNAEINLDTSDFSVNIRPYCNSEDGSLAENVLLSVYRREFDGRFTALAERVENTRGVFITDPHPALDYARYRIVAIAKDTGAVGYYDMPGYPVGASAIIIQWDETWTSFSAYTEDGEAVEDELAYPSRSGSMLILPYNVDVSDSYQPDVSLVKYIGRKHPVSYYGTQMGETSTWNTVIPKSDEETLYGLRRLSLWTGDVYVREPSGSGYWAHVKVSFNQKHKDVTIPVTLNITRVEGGV